MAETPEQYRKRIARSTQFWDGIPITGYRAICVHCGSKNRVQKRWRTMTCGACRRKGPVLDDTRAKEILSKSRGVASGSQNYSTGNAENVFGLIAVLFFLFIIAMSCART